MSTTSPSMPGITARCLGLLALFGVLAAPCVHAQAIRMGGTGSGVGTLQLLSQEYRKTDPSFQFEVVPNLGSGGGVKALIGGGIQIAVTSRPVKNEERAKGVRSIEYGRTAFVLVTAKDGMNSLSSRQVAEMYAGSHATWPDGTPVRLVLRPASDGDSTLLADMSPEIKAGLDKALAREGMVIGMTDQEAVDAVERLPGGLGTAAMALLLSEQRRAKPIAIDGIAPTLDNLASGRYPHAKLMYLVVRDDMPPSVLKFVNFVRSEAGRRVLARTGHLPTDMPPVAAR